MKFFKQAACFLCCFLMANPLPLLAGTASSRPLDTSPSDNRGRQSRRKVTLPPSGLGNRDTELVVMTSRTGLTGFGDQTESTLHSGPGSTGTTGQGQRGVRAWDPTTYETGATAGHPSSLSLLGVPQDNPGKSPREAGRNYLNLVYIYTLTRGCEGRSSTGQKVAPPQQMLVMPFSANPTYHDLSLRSFDPNASATEDYLVVGAGEPEEHYEAPVFVQQPIDDERKNTQTPATGPSEPDYLVPVSGQQRIYEQRKNTQTPATGPSEPDYLIPVSGRTEIYQIRKAQDLNPVYDLGEGNGGEGFGFGQQPLYDNQANPEGSVDSESDSDGSHTQPEYAIASAGFSQIQEDVGSQPLYDNRVLPHGNASRGDPQPDYDLASSGSPQMLNGEGYYHQPTPSHYQVLPGHQRRGVSTGSASLNPARRGIFPSDVGGNPDYAEPNPYGFTGGVAEYEELGPDRHCVKPRQLPGPAYETLSHLHGSEGSKLWLKGQRFPISDAPTRTSVLKIYAFGQTSTTVLWYELASGLGALLSTAPMPGSIQFLFTGTPTVRTLYDLSAGPHPLAMALGLFFVAPVAAGIIKAKRSASLSDEEVQKAFKRIQTTLATIQPSVWQDYLAYFFPVKSGLRHSMALLSQGLWDARLWNPEMGLTEPDQLLKSVITSHGGFTRFAALDLLAQVAGFEEADFLNPERWHDLFKSRNEALSLLQKLAQSRTPYGLYARSCLASIGHTGTGETILWTGVKTVPYVVALLGAADLIRTMVDLMSGTTPHENNPSAASAEANTGVNCSLPNQQNCSTPSVSSPAPSSTTSSAPTSSTPVESSSTTTSSAPTSSTPVGSSSTTTSSAPTSSTSVGSSSTTTSSAPTSSTPVESSSTTTSSAPTSSIPVESSSTTTSSAPTSSTTSSAPTSSTPVESSSTTTSSAPTSSTPVGSSPTTTSSAPTSSTPAVTLSPQQEAQQCLGGILGSFLEVPGRPVNQILDALETYPMPAGAVPFSLDLSGMVNATYAIDLIQGIRTRFENLIITDVDLSGAVFSNTDLNEVLEALPPTVRTLNVSLPYRQDAPGILPTIPNGGTLFGSERFPVLESIDISRNNFFGNSPQFQTFITYLEAVPQLKKLHCRTNRFFATSSDRGPLYPRFLMALGAMENLTVLDLTGHGISRYSPQTDLLTQALAHKPLQTLILTHNHLGNDPNGTLSFLSNLSSTLKELNLENTGIGKIPTTPSQLSALTQALSSMTNLTDFNFRWSWLPLNTTESEQLAFVTGLPSSMNSVFGLVTSSASPPFAVSAKDLLRGRFGHLPGNATDVRALCNASDVETLFAQFPTNQSTLNLARSLLLTPEVIDTVAERLPSQIRELDLSGNLLEAGGYTGYSENLSAAVARLTALEGLNLADNLIKAYSTDNIPGLDWNLGIGLARTARGLEAWLDTVATLNNLSSFNFDNNQIQPSFNLTKLTEAFNKKLQLQHLSLRNTRLGVPAPLLMTFAEALGSLNLTTLDLSFADLGLSSEQQAIDNAIARLGLSLRNLTQLEVLDLSNNRLGYYFVGAGEVPTHGTSIASALPFLTKLRRFEIGFNYLQPLDLSARAYPQGPEAVNWILGNLSSPSLQSVDFSGLSPTADYWNGVGSKWTNLTLEGVGPQCPTSAEGSLAELLQNASSSQPGRRSINQDPFLAPQFEEMSFVTSGASALKPPAIFDIFPMVFGLVHQAYKGVSNPFSLLNTPSSSSDFPSGVLPSGGQILPVLPNFPQSQNGTLTSEGNTSRNATLPGSDSFTDPRVHLREELGSKEGISTSHVRAPDLEATALGVIGVMCGIKSLYTWFVTPEQKPAPVIYASAKEAQTHLRQTRHLLKQTTAALDALGERTNQGFFGQTLQEYEDTLARLKESRDSRSEGPLTSIPLEALSNLKADVQALLEELEDQLTANFAVKRHGRWVVDYIPSGGNKDLEQMGPRLEVLKGDLRAMHTLLPQEDRILDYAKIFLECEKTFRALTDKPTVPQLAIPALANQIKELSDILDEVRTHHYIERRDGVWMLDFSSYLDATKGIERTTRLLEEAHRAFEALSSASLLDQDPLDSYKQHLSNLEATHSHLLGLLSRSTPQELKSHVPTKGVVQLQEGLNAFVNDMRRILHV